MTLIRLMFQATSSRPFISAGQHPGGYQTTGYSHSIKATIVQLAAPTRLWRPQAPKDASMLRLSLISTALLSAASAAPAQTDDPTFNGIVVRAACYVRNVTACRAASCEQVASNCQGDLCGTFNLFLRTRQFSTEVEKKPLQIVAISPAEVGKPLWVKFEVPTKDGPGEGRLTLRPERLQGYTTTAVVFVPAAGDATGRSFSLINYQCEAMSDEP